MLSDKINAIKQEIKVSVKDNVLADKANTAITENVEKVRMYYNMLIEQGKQTQAYAFMVKAYEYIKGVLHKLIGHMKDLYARVCAAINLHVLLSK